MQHWAEDTKLIREFGSIHEMERCEEVPKEMKENLVHPNEVTYAILIAGWKKCLEYLREAQNRSVVSLKYFNTVIDMCGKQGNFVLAE